MLHEIILKYIDAVKSNDERLARRIECELATLGMDKMTLLTLVKEYTKEGLV